MLALYLTTILDRGHRVTVNRSQEHSTGTLLNSECTGGDKLYSGEEIWCSKLSTEEGKLVLYCSQQKVIGAILISGEGNWHYTVFRRKELVHYCFHEKGTGAPLNAGEGNWCPTVFRRKKLEHYCSQGEGH